MVNLNFVQNNSDGMHACIESKGMAFLVIRYHVEKLCKTRIIAILMYINKRVIN
jgi:hypothetical protein